MLTARALLILLFSAKIQSSDPSETKTENDDQSVTTVAQDPTPADENDNESPLSSVPAVIKNEVTASTSFEQSRSDPYSNPTEKPIRLRIRLGKPKSGNSLEMTPDVSITASNEREDQLVPMEEETLNDSTQSTQSGNRQPEDATSVSNPSTYTMIALSTPETEVPYYSDPTQKPKSLRFKFRRVKTEPEQLDTDMGGGYLPEQTSQDTSQIRPSDSNIKTEPNLTTQIKTEGDTVEGNVYHPQTDISSTQPSSPQEGLVISDIRQMNRKPILRIEPFNPTPGQTTYQIIKQPSDESSQIQYKVLPLDSDRLDVSRKSQPLTTPESPVDSPEMSTVDGVLSQVIEQLSGDNQEKMEAFLKKKNEILDAAEENSPTHDADDDTNSESTETDSSNSPQAPSAQQPLRDNTAKTLEFSQLTPLEKLAWMRGLAYDATRRCREKKKALAKTGENPCASMTEADNDGREPTVSDISDEQTSSVYQEMDSPSTSKNPRRRPFVDATKLKEYVEKFLKGSMVKYRKMPEYGFNGKTNEWTDDQIAEKRLEIINSQANDRQRRIETKRMEGIKEYKEFMKKSAELKRQAVQDPATKTVSPQRKKPEKKTVSKSTITDESIPVTTDNISQEVATHAKTKFVEQPKAEPSDGIPASLAESDVLSDLLVSSSRPSDIDTQSQSSGVDTIGSPQETCVDQPLSEDTSRGFKSAGQTALEKLAHTHAYGIARRQVKKQTLSGEKTPLNQPLPMPKDPVKIYLRDVMPKYADDDEFNKDQYGNKLTINQLAEKILARKTEQKRKSYEKICKEKMANPAIREQLLQRNREQKKQSRERKRAATRENEPRKRRKKAAFTQRTVEQASATDTDQTSQEDPTYINSVAVGTHDLPNDDGSTTSSIQNQETIDEPPKSAEMERIKRQFEEYRQSLLEPLPIKSEPIDVKSGEYQNDALNDIFASHPDWQ